MLRHADAFAGVGGFTLALQNISAPSLYCEVDPTAQSVLRHQMTIGGLPTAPILADVVRLREHLRGMATPHILTAGFPCTGTSVAGLRAGLDHPDTGLINNVIASLHEHHVPLLILENSPTMNNTANFVERFEHLGYHQVSTTANAYIAGVPQNRNRWYALFVRDGCHKILLRFAKLLQQHPTIPLTREPARTTQRKESWSVFKVRYSLIGRTIVPGCARAVLLFLSRRLLSGEQGYARLQHAAQQPNLRLVYKLGGVQFGGRVWPTPRSRNPCTCNKLNARICRDLPSAVKFEVNTKPGQLNLAWVEWLQGFPRNWTATPIRG